MNKKELTLEERKMIQLEMLDEIDAFCRDNNIKYSLAFGTMLGAVRHKGFIPWDDDLDIMIPLSELDKFKSGFKSTKLEYIDIDNQSEYYYYFPRITDRRTFNRLPNGRQSYGVSIDLYLIANIPDEENERQILFSKAQAIQKPLHFLVVWNSRLKRYLHFPFQLPGLQRTVQRMRDLFIVDNYYGATNSYYALAGLLELRNTMIYDRDLFNTMIELEFEGKQYMCIKDYDYFLSKRYGDYMTLPPLDKRVPYHGGCYYWK